MRKGFRRAASCLPALVVVLGVAGPAWAWGPRGHRVAARVAEARLTPEAKEGVRELLHEGDTLADVAGWADHEGHDDVPGSAPWHYVNVPITAARYDDRYCGGSNCVVAKVKHFRKVLTDRSVPKRDRTRALLFLVHFVEDVHQPLHVGDNHDQGGNRTQVQYFDEGTNLHRLWDSQLIDGASRDDRAWVKTVTSLITPERAAEWSKGGVEDWADESLQEAKKAYHFPKDAAGPVGSGVRLGKDYVEHAIPVIRLRLAQAGVRVANELNAAFADAERRPAGEREKAKARRTVPAVVR